uniref:Uncharacterized protein n=1 Tax=Arundo donax TaxID=35708 RepID=A0A0A8YK77_ARUDO
MACMQLRRLIFTKTALAIIQLCLSLTLQLNNYEVMTAYSVMTTGTKKNKQRSFNKSRGEIFDTGTTMEE